MPLPARGRAGPSRSTRVRRRARCTRADPGHASSTPPQIRTAATIASSRMTPRLLKSPCAVCARMQEVVLRLRVEEEHRAHLLGGLEERQELRLVPLLAVHVGVELGAFQPELRDRVLELVDRGLHVLHRQRREAREARRPLLASCRRSLRSRRARARAPAPRRGGSRRTACGSRPPARPCPARPCPSGALRACSAPWAR